MVARVAAMRAVVAERREDDLAAGTNLAPDSPVRTWTSYPAKAA